MFAGECWRDVLNAEDVGNAGVCWTDVGEADAGNSGVCWRDVGEAETDDAGNAGDSEDS